MSLSLGERLRELRMNLNLSAEKLGEMVGKSKSTIIKYEKNLRDPSSDTLKKFSEIFNVSIDSLIQGDDKTMTDIEDDILQYLHLPLDQIAKDKNVEVNGKVPSKSEIDMWIRTIHYLSSHYKEE